MTAGNEQTELRSLADFLDTHHDAWLEPEDVALLRRAADRLDRLTEYAAFVEEEGDA